MSQKKKPSFPRPLTRPEAETLFARIERGCDTQSEETGIIKRLVSSPDVTIPFLISRLKHGNITDQGLAGHVLALIEDDRAKKSLWELSRDPEISASARSMVFSTLQDMGEDVENEIRASGLDGSGPAAEALMEDLMKNITGDETLLEVMVHDIEGWPGAKRTEMIRLLGQKPVPGLLRFLLPLLHAREKLTTMTAIDALEELNLPAAAPALNLISEVSPQPEIRTRARAVCSKLATAAASAPLQDQPSPVEPLPRLPLFGSMTTLIDGDGAQMIMVGRKRPDGQLKMVSVMFNDHQGIKDCQGASGVPVADWKKILSQISEIPWVPLELSLCRALLDEAITLNKKVHRKLPMELEIWGHLLKDGPEAAQLWKEDKPLAIPQEMLLDPKLIEKTADLPASPFFESWGFDGRQLEFSDLAAFGAVLHARGKKSQQIGVVLESIVHRIAKPKVRAMLERRLRRQAWLLQILGKTDQSRLALAAASALNEKSGIPVAGQPFMKAMVAKSIVIMTQELQAQE